VTDRSPTKALALPHAHKNPYVDTCYRDDATEDPDDDDPLAYAYHRRAAVGARLARQEKAVVVSARTNRSRPVELPVEETSPPSSTSSDKPPAPALQQQAGRAADLERLEPEPNRTGSMLLQLIACGSTTPAAGGSGGKCRSEPRRSCGLVSRLSSRAGAVEEGDDLEACGELDRRFVGHLAPEDKEYFSGSIVEGGRGTPLPASSLKRSNSYNEER
jgi:hypothetical protein